MKKKILAVVLIAVVFLVCLTACSGDNTGIEEVAYFEDGVMKYVLIKEKNFDNTEKFYVKAVSYIGQEYTSPEQNISVTIPAKVTYEDNEYDVVSVGSLAFNRKNVTNVYVEEGISIIENFAFGYCDLTYLELPSTIMEIGEYTFVGCNSLGEIRLNAITPPKLGGYAFKIYNEKDNVYMINGKLRIYVPKDAESTYKNATSWSEYSGIISKQ